jgi:hypothetical protein
MIVRDLRSYFDHEGCALRKVSSVLEEIVILGFLLSKIDLAVVWADEPISRNR